MKRKIPDWFAPAAYSAIVIAAVLAIGALTRGNGSGPPAVPQPAGSKPLAARAPVDTPESAPQLSPVYPTANYGQTSAVGQADLARRLAREGNSSSGETPRRGRSSWGRDSSWSGERETSGSGSFDRRMERPEPSQ